jgi:hypothetical protein
MHHTMSHMHHGSSSGIVEQALGLAGRLSALADRSHLRTGAQGPRGPGAAPRLSCASPPAFGEACVAILEAQPE